MKNSAVIWGKLACPSQRVQRERHSACALNGHASFSQITAELVQLLAARDGSESYRELGLLRNVCQGKYKYSK